MRQFVVLREHIMEPLKTKMTRIGVSRSRSGLAMVLAVASVVAVLCAPALAQRSSLAMLDRLERGNWELRMRDAGGETEAICLGDGRRLIQLRHPAERCSSVIVGDTNTEVTVQYTCPGKGYGRTHIRRESSRLVQIESQGIAHGLPFAFVAEARRVGDCSR
jgi:hypothetical protein